jgi:hypothetical protein
MHVLYPASLLASELNLLGDHDGALDHGGCSGGRRPVVHEERQSSDHPSEVASLAVHLANLC